MLAPRRGLARLAAGACLAAVLLAWPARANAVEIASSGIAAQGQVVGAAAGRTPGETAAGAPGDITAGAPGDTVASPCFREPPVWETPPELLLAAPTSALPILDLLIDPALESGMLDAAEAGVRRWLGLDEVAVERGGIRLRKKYGERLTVRSSAGIGPSAEDAAEAAYRLWDSWYVRSEARERGETVLEVRRELRFW
jgi:hypothetical protein